MRVLHAAGHLTGPLQIMRQMAWEQSAAEELGLHWHTRMFCPKDTPGIAPVLVEAEGVTADSGARSGKLNAWIRLRREYYRWLVNQLAHYDVFVLRYCSHDPYQAAFARLASKPVVFVHHAFEVEELRLGGGLRGRARASAEALMGPVCGKRAAGLVGVTREIAEYEGKRLRRPDAPLHVYPNGISYEEEPPADDLRGDVPEFLFVAGPFFPWHGLDRLMEACARSHEAFRIHLVGEMPEQDMEAARSDARLVVHGRLPRQEVTALARRCWLGFSSFAVDRSGMRQAATLKVREYLREGLPVYAGYEDVFAPDFPYFRQGPADLSSILDFGRQCRGISRATVAEAARPYIEKKMLVGQLYAYLQGLMATEQAPTLRAESGREPGNVMQSFGQE